MLPPSSWFVLQSVSVQSCGHLRDICTPNCQYAFPCFIVHILPTFPFPLLHPPPPDFNPKLPTSGVGVWPGHGDLVPATVARSFAQLRFPRYVLLCSALPATHILEPSVSRSVSWLLVACWKLGATGLSVWALGAHVEVVLRGRGTVVKSG